MCVVVRKLSFSLCIHYLFLRVVSHPSALLLRCSIHYRLLMATINCPHPGVLTRCLPVDCYLTGAVLFLLVAAAARRASAGVCGEEKHAG
jgi:hypothetical protein